MSENLFFIKYLQNYKKLLKDNPGDFWYTALYFSFWISLALFPIGYGWREVTPCISFVFLLLYYKYEWKNSVLFNLKPKWLFICCGLMILIGIIFSTNPWASLLHAGTGINKAYILPFISMECCRDQKSLIGLVWASVFACFWEGLDGIWQTYSGYDFIMGYKINNGRLTGSLGDYTVGNYMVLALIPAFGVWFILREKLGFWASLFICIALFWPAVVIFQGAATRSGILALAGALTLWNFISHKRIDIHLFILPIIAIAIFLILQTDRFTPDRIINDNRWDLWQIALKVFWEYPWFGAGAGQYNSVFRALGLAPQNEVITISHPHNLYIDILYAHGIVGFLLGMLFLFGFLFWGYRNIKTMLLSQTSNSTYWKIAAWFWLGYAAWLINGIFGHDFYRIWWLALAMCSLGIMIGSIVKGISNIPKSHINSKD